MTAQQAAAAWQRRQTQLLASTYARAWHQGAAAYRSQHATPPAAGAATTPPPAKPAAVAMSRALNPALASLARMAAMVATIIPTTAQLAASGTVSAAIALAAREWLASHAGHSAAIALAAREWLASHAWLLAAGVSVAWAGEQAGYAQAADADGQLLEWQLDPAVLHHCADCPALATLPPLPLNLWPTLPGEGATECNVGCRCSMRAVAATPPTLTGAQHELLSRMGNRQPVLVAA